MARTGGNIFDNRPAIAVKVPFFLCAVGESQDIIAVFQRIAESILALDFNPVLEREQFRFLLAAKFTAFQLDCEEVLRGLTWMRGPCCAMRVVEETGAFCD